MYYYKVNEIKIKSKLLEMEQDNKKWYKLSKDIYKYMEIPISCNIRVNTDVLEVCKIPNEYKTQFNKTICNQGYHARKNSAINKKWLECIDKFNLKYHYDFDFYINIDLDLFCKRIGGSGMTILEDIKEIVISSEINLNKIESLSEIDEVTYHNFFINNSKNK